MACATCGLACSAVQEGEDCVYVLCDGGLMGLLLEPVTGAALEVRLGLQVCR